MAIPVLALACTLLFQGQATAAAPTYKFDQAEAWKWLIKQCDIGPRFPGSPGQAQCRDLILAETKKHCTNVSTQAFSHVWSRNSKKYDMWNVIGYQNWDTATTRVVLLTHWDTRPTADMEAEERNQKKPIIGASDGASGTAVLLELMRHTNAIPKSLGICYLFVDGEDLGPGLNEMFLGAVHFSKNLPKPKPNYGILLDMVGDKDLKIPIEPNSYRLAKDVTLALYRHAKEIKMGDTFPMEYGDEIYDDHLALNDAGIPTVDLIDFTYSPWHTLRDTPEECSADSLGKVGRFLESWLMQPEPWKRK